MPKISFGPITVMQDMTSSICSEIANNTEGLLTDTRDGKVYHVRKQIDGRCWMVQNLALDLSMSKTLTPSDTNITTNWKPSASISTGSLSSSTTIAQSSVRSWNAGAQYVIKRPMSKPDDVSMDSGTYAACGVSKEVASSSGVAVLPTSLSAGKGSGAYGTSACTDYFTNIATGYTPDYEANATSMDFTTINGKEYDSHYLVGNYYTFYAATAGTGTLSGDTVKEAATSSICPRGWTLPSVGYHDADKNNPTSDFRYLLSLYGYKSLSNTPEVDKNTQENLLFQAPFYLVKGGHITSPRSNGLITSGINNAGGGAHYLGRDGRFDVTVGYRVYLADWLYAPGNVRCINDPSI